MNEQSQEQSIVVAAGATLLQADMIRLRLESEGVQACILDEHVSRLYWHASLIVNPNGIRVAVRQSDAELANEILKTFDLERQKVAELRKAQPPTPFTPNELALDGFRMAIFSVLFPPLWLVSCVWLIRAYRAARKVQPESPTKFRSYQTTTLIILLLLLAAALMFIRPYLRL